MDISRLSSHYKIRVLTVSDVGIILDLCQQNTFFYEYTEAQPTSEQILDDMKQTPPGIDMSAKYYVGFFEGHLTGAFAGAFPDADCRLCRNTQPRTQEP